MPKQLNINELKPGMVIVQIVAQNGPVKIRKSGLISSFDMIQGLADMGVLEVEIDPAQTVELEQPEIHQSQTQKLLKSDHFRAAQTESRHSEQLNRSLFLPSVQELPSIWQYYGKLVVMAVIVIIGGFALGWSGATFPRWWPFLQPVAKPVAQIISAEQPETVQAEPKPQQTTDLTATENQSQVGTSMVTSAEDDILVPKPKQGPVSKITQRLAEVEEQAAEAQNEAVPSEELLKKFRDAVAQLEEKPDQSYAEQTIVPSDVIRIEQLPAWALTQLPAMAFSAHMYVSDPAKRWVRVNGQQLVEGDMIDDDLRIVRIDPQHVILVFRGQEFSMEALTDW